MNIINQELDVNYVSDILSNLSGSSLSIGSDFFSKFDDSIVKSLCKKGVKSICITDKVLLNFLDEKFSGSSLLFLRTLKFCTARGIDVRWKLKRFKGDSIEYLNHLWPPQCSNMPSEIENYWRFVYRFGACYWRNGGDFLEVIDKRNPNNQSQHIIDEVKMLKVFRAGVNLGCLKDFEGDDEVFKILKDVGLIITDKVFFLTLPYRIAEWPVPYRSI